MSNYNWGLRKRRAPKTKQTDPYRDMPYFILQPRKSPSSPTRMQLTHAAQQVLGVSEDKGYVILGLNPETKRFAIQACDADTDYASKVHSIGKDRANIFNARYYAEFLKLGGVEELHEEQLFRLVAEGEGIFRLEPTSLQEDVPPVAEAAGFSGGGSFKQQNL